MLLPSSTATPWQLVPAPTSTLAITCCAWAVGIGGLLGTVIGVLFAFLVSQALNDLGLGFALPVGQLVIFLVLAVVVGVVAAIVPARRGSRLQVLEALGAE